MHSISTFAPRARPLVPKAERAGAWCLEQMDADGFETVRGQPVMGPVWRRGHCSVWLREPRDGLFAECLGETELTVAITEGGRLAVLDRALFTLRLDAGLLELAAGDRGGAALLRLVTRHEWRHACGGALYGALLGSVGTGGSRQIL